jgi:hypothetical protein
MPTQTASTAAPYLVVCFRFINFDSYSCYAIDCITVYCELWIVILRRVDTIPYRLQVY